MEFQPPSREVINCLNSKLPYDLQRAVMEFVGEDDYNIRYKLIFAHRIQTCLKCIHYITSIIMILLFFFTPAIVLVCAVYPIFMIVIYLVYTTGENLISRLQNYLNKKIDKLNISQLLNT